MRSPSSEPAPAPLVALVVVQPARLLPQHGRRFRQLLPPSPLPGGQVVAAPPLTKRALARFSTY